MDNSFHSNQATRLTRSVVSWMSCGCMVFCLVVPMFVATGARAQGVDGPDERGSGRDAYQWSAQNRILLYPVLWQQDEGPSHAPGPPPGPPGPLVRRGPRGRAGMPPALLERLQNLPPEQREKVLENNRRFLQLPPERQEQLRLRLRQLMELSPEQREMVEQRFAIFSNLSPKQQEKARKIYEDRWRELAPERRRALLQEFRRLRRLDPEKRKQRLDSKELQDQFSSEEREVLAQLIAL